MTTATLALVAWLLPLGIAASLLLVRPLRHTGRPAAALSLAGAFAVLGLALKLLLEASGHHGEPASVSWPWLVESGRTMVELGVYVDGTSASMLVVVAMVALAVQLFSWEYMSDEPPEGFGRYYAFQSLFLFSMNGLVLAPNMFQLFVGWELVGVCSYFLIGFWNKKPSAARAAMKAFWMTKLADIGMIIALLVQYTHTQRFGWDGAAAELLAGSSASYLGVSITSIVAAGYFFAAMGKSAQFPLHIWLPDAMEGPTPVSALLHAATMVAAGVYMLVRAAPLFEQAHGVLLFMAFIGGITAFMAATIAVVQTDIKKVLAYSTISQLGYMVAAMGAGDAMAGYFHLTTHAFFKALLFLAAGSIIHGVHSQEMADMGGLFRKMKLTSGAFLVGTLALMGVPPFSGFFSKDLVLEALLHGTHHEPLLWVPLVLLLGGVFLTAFYMGRVLFLAFFGEPSEEVSHAHEGGPFMLSALGLLAVLAVGAGFAGTSMSHLWGFEPYHFHVTPIGVGAMGLALAGLGASWHAFGRGSRAAWVASFTPVGDLIRSGLIDRSFLWVYRAGLRALAAAVAWLDRYIIDALMNVSGVLTLRAGSRLRTLQTGQAGDYVSIVIIGAILCATISRVIL